MKKQILTVMLAVLSAGVFSAFAGDQSSKEMTSGTAEFTAFRKGVSEVELRAGALFSMSGNVPTRPALNYALEAVRWGWMFDNVHGSGFLRGNDELLLEAFGGEVFHGPGNWLAGGMLILRHNFVQDGSRFVPYLQIGGGGLDNDIYHDQVQHRVGEAFEFMLHGGLGARWMVTDRWAISTEADFRHVSNADLARRNGGLDSLGATLGVNFLY